MCMCTATYFNFIFCTASYCYVLQLEMQVRLIRAIKFYLLTYLLILYKFHCDVSGFYALLLLLLNKQKYM